jgi:hypothetical protein
MHQGLAAAIRMSTLVLVLILAPAVVVVVVSPNGAGSLERASGRGAPAHVPEGTSIGEADSAFDVVGAGVNGR